MARFQFKVCRQIGENIWQSKRITGKQSVLLKNLKKKFLSQKGSDFLKKLQQMKKLAYFYGLHSLNNYQGIKSYPTFLDKRKSLLLKLESRLDVSLVRSSFCQTLFFARQLILHQKIRVNFTSVSIPSYIVKTGDFISVVPDQVPRLRAFFKETIKKSNDLPVGSPYQNNLEPVYHLETNLKTFHMVFLYEPTQIRFPYKLNLDLLF